jgi:hypothetical protein
MSTSSEPSPTEIDALTQRLAAMPLAPAALSRDKLFFEAGQAHGAARRRRRFVLAAMVLSCVSLAVGVFFERWTSPGPTIQEVLVFAQQQAPKPEKPAPPKVVKDSASEKKTRVESLAGTPRHYSQVGDFEALLSETGPLQPTMPMSPANESVEEILGLPAGSLNELERSRWKMALNLGGKS